MSEQSETYGLEVGEDTGEEYILTEVFDKEVYKLPEDFVLTSGGVVDVGANIGAFSVYASKWPGVTSIRAYEPNPDVYTRLVNNTKNIPEVSTFPVGLSDKTVEATLWLRKGRTGSGRLRPASARFNLPVGIRLLNAAVALQDVTIDVLKVDTEGSEPSIIAALAYKLPDVQLVFMEWHSKKDLRYCLRYLSDSFVVEVSSRKDEIGTLVARNRKRKTTCGETLELGEHISGLGTWRDVYALRNKPGEVVKIARSPRPSKSGRLSFPKKGNLRELQRWREASPEIKAWYVPVLGVYDEGTYLVQERGMPVTLAEAKRALKDAPPAIRCMGDSKAENFVRHGGRIKRCDYE